MTPLDALRSSIDRLHATVADLPEADLSRSAYPSEWTIADVLSHLGSGAVIFRRRLEDVVAGQDTPDDFMQGVWDEWNAKPPADQRADGLAADAALLEALERVTAEERAAATFAMGPMELDFDNYVGMRLNEHALHTWDVAVALDPTATVPDDVARLVAANLTLIARFTARPTGASTTITIASPAGAQGLTVELTPDAATATVGPPAAPADLVLDADALARLVYGRLDPAHTPAGAEGPQLDTLRQVFPGP